MKDEQKYLNDLADIRSMMERTSKFLSLSGWAGIMAGIYALAGSWIAYQYYSFNPDKIVYPTVQSGNIPPRLTSIILLATAIVILAIGTAVYLSYRKGKKQGRQIWNAASRQLLVNMAVPLFTGAIIIFILIAKGLLGLVAPFTMLFYGLAIYNASKFTYNEMQYLGLIQISLGLIGSWFIEYGLLLWAIGFGLIHIAYGIHMHFKYER